MHIKKWMVLIFCTVISLLSTSPVLSQEAKETIMDYFFGGYIGFEPVNWLHLSVGAGPLLIWGMRQSKPEESTAEEITAESVVEFGAGLYARACVDIFLSKTFGINAGVRKTDTTLSFKDAAGETDIEGWQYYIGLAFRF